MNPIINLHYDTIDILIDDIKNDTKLYKAQCILDYLNDCNCCERHNKNKPYLFTSWTWLSKKQIFNTHDCKCQCRHLARTICRAYPN